MKLDETIGLMCSEDYKDRLKAEYLQLVIRLKKLERYFVDMDSSERLSVKGGHMREQIENMKAYRSSMRRRLQDEEILWPSLDAIVMEGE